MSNTLARAAQVGRGVGQVLKPDPLSGRSALLGQLISWCGAGHRECEISESLRNYSIIKATHYLIGYCETVLYVRAQTRETRTHAHSSNMKVVVISPINKAFSAVRVLHQWFINVRTDHGIIGSPRYPAGAKMLHAADNARTTKMIEVTS